MAKRRKGGHRAPSQYDPRRGKKPKPGRARGASEHAKPDGDAESLRGPRLPHASGRRSTPDQRNVAREAPFDAAGQFARAVREIGGAPPADPREEGPAGTPPRAFGDLGLGPNIVRTLAELGADSPFPIQSAAIPDILRGRDLLGRAHTGTGKTIAFGAGVVERLLLLKSAGAFRPAARERGSLKRGERNRAGHPSRNPKAMILAPTRELALQIDATVQPIARSVGFYTAQLVGGVPLEPQLHALERGADIVIGTPGRMQDLINRRKLDLREVVISVVDEADHMSDLGFLEPTQKLLRYTVARGQRVLFSATLDEAVTVLATEFLRDPAKHEVTDAQAELDTEHRFYVVLREHKDDALLELTRHSGRTIVFCRTRAYATRTAEFLTQHAISAVPLHGDLSQSRRERNLERFATGKARVIVATDVAARGIHVDAVDLVLQADPPDDPKTYLHRAGRTGRAGSTGRVITVIPRTRQQRTRELIENAGIDPAYFGDFIPTADEG